MKMKGCDVIMICDTCKYLNKNHNKYPCSECLKYCKASKYKPISKGDRKRMTNDEKMIEEIKEEMKRHQEALRDIMQKYDPDYNKEIDRR